MKHTCILLIITVFALIMVSSCSTDSTKEAAAIDQVRQAFNTAFNSEDIQAMESIIDENAIWSISGISPIDGRDSVLAAYSKAFSTSNSWLEVNEGNLQISGDWAILTTTFNRSDTVYSNDSLSNVVEVFGNNMLVFKKQADKSWKIARDIWN